MKKLSVHLASLALAAALMLPWTIAEAAESFKKFGVILREPRDVPFRHAGKVAFADEDIGVIRAKLSATIT